MLQQLQLQWRGSREPLRPSQLHSSSSSRLLCCRESFYLLNNERGAGEGALFPHSTPALGGARGWISRSYHVSPSLFSSPGFTFWNQLPHFLLEDQYWGYQRPQSCSECWGLTSGPWFVVPGSCSWSLVPTSWPLVRGSWFLAPAFYVLALDFWVLTHG